jgi:hypothetical protein
MDRTMTKVGAGAAMLGAVVAIVFNILYPRPDDPGSVSEFVELASTEGAWAFTNYMLAWATGLALLGLIVIARSFKREPSVSWARPAMLFAVGGGTALFISLVALGFAMKSAVEMADAATAEAVGYVAGAVFLASIGGFFGFAPLLYGIAVVTGDEYPAWLGWVAILAGAVGLVAGTIIYFDGFSTLTDVVLFPIASLLFTAWTGIMGYTLWQRASAPATTT